MPVRSYLIELYLWEFWYLGRGSSSKKNVPLSIMCMGPLTTYGHFEISFHFLEHIVNVNSSPKLMLGPANGWDFSRYFFLFLGLQPWYILCMALLILIWSSFPYFHFKGSGSMQRSLICIPLCVDTKFCLLSPTNKSY